MKTSTSSTPTARLTRTVLLVIAASGLAAIFSGCYGPAVRHDHRVDHRHDRRDDRHHDRYDRRDDRHDDRDDRRGDRYQRRTDRYYY